MPELPEVETLRTSLEPLLRGEHLAEVTVREPRLRRRIDRASLGRAVGHSVRSVERRAKYLWIRLEGGVTLVVHLGMSGRLSVSAPVADDRWDAHEHVRWSLASGRLLRYCDPRRFGLVYTVADDRIARHRDFCHLGVEPLARDFDAAYLASRSRGRRAPVKAFLMDQRIVVGVGNIYASEVLFRAGVSPRRSAGNVGPRRWARIVEATRVVLADAIAAGGTTIRDYVDGRGEIGAFQHTLAVYGREGKPCITCGAPVRRSVMSGRATYACGQCQR